MPIDKLVNSEKEKEIIEWYYEELDSGKEDKLVILEIIGGYYNLTRSKVNGIILKDKVKSLESIKQGELLEESTLSKGNNSDKLVNSEKEKEIIKLYEELDSGEEDRLTLLEKISKLYNITISKVDGILFKNERDIEKEKYTKIIEKIKLLEANSLKELMNKIGNKTGDNCGFFSNGAYRVPESIGLYFFWEKKDGKYFVDEVYNQDSFNQKCKKRWKEINS